VRANERAIRCYRACGFVEEGRQRKAKWLAGRYIDWVSMAILREEWEESRHSAAGGQPG
jgi:RimJ/RimL family protein N-acetyltransferase